MTKDIEWLKGLKEGDKVATQNALGWSRNSVYRVHVIVKVTPSGRINLNSGEVIDPITGMTRGENNKKILPITPEIEANIQHQRNVSMIKSHLSKVDLYSQDLDKIQKLSKFMEDLGLTEKAETNR
ncbi:hypothetical protein [Psychrobacillus sp. FSL K6-1464]|uniref:hypothetical protein n=1 Tax=Psychrobacillus sp. FSL K6-1464 TaxID=2921545 RepID=UPI0030F76FB2